MVFCCDRVIRQNKTLPESLKWYRRTVGTVRLYGDSENLRTFTSVARSEIDTAGSDTHSSSQALTVQTSASTQSMSSGKESSSIQMRDKVRDKYEPSYVTLSADDLYRGMSFVDSSYGEPKAVKVVNFILRVCQMLIFPLYLHSTSIYSALCR